MSPTDGQSRFSVNPTFEWSNLNRATSYIVQLFADTSNNPLSRRRYIVQPDAGASTNFTLSEAGTNNDPLDPGRTYYWSVRGQDADGPGPESSRWRFVTDDRPEAPTSVRTVGAVGENSFTLRWRDNASNEDLFQVQIRTETGAWQHSENVPALSGTGDQQATIDFENGDTQTPLRANTQYYVRVRARRNSGSDSAWSAEIPVLTADDRPAAPTNVRSAGIGEDSFILRWQDNATNESGFEVQVRTATGAWQHSENVPARAGTGDQEALIENVNGNTGERLRANTQYFVRVRSYRPSGQNSAWSEEISVMTADDRPAAPTNLRSTGTGETSFGIAWQDNATNEDGFRVQVRTENGDWQPSENVPRVEGTGGQQAVIEFLNGDTDERLRPNTLYFVRVRSYRSSGQSSGWSNEISVMTADDRPAAPTNLRSTGTGETSFAIAWHDNATNEDGFRVQVRTENGDWQPSENVPRVDGTGGQQAVIQFLNGDTDERLRPNTQYYVRVRAYRSSGQNSGWSNEIPVMTVDDRPAAPSNVRTTSIGETSFTLAWRDNSTNEDGFRVQVRTENGDWQPSENVPRVDGTGGQQAVIQFLNGDTDERLRPNTLYFVRVRAYRSSGQNSAWSDEISVMTADDRPTNLRALDVEKTSFTLKWRDNATEESGFEVQIRTETGSWRLSERVPPQANTGDKQALIEFENRDTQARLRAGTQYYVRVRAYRDAGPESAWSDELPVVTDSDQPAAPTNIRTVGGIGVSSFTLGWRDNAMNEDGFQVQIRTTTGAWQHSKNVAALSGVGDQQTEIKYENGDTGALVRANTQYFVRVRARRDGASDSDWSAELPVLTASNQPPAGPVDLSGFTAGAFSVGAGGSASYSIPIEISPGIGGIQPSLAIAYSSQSGNGLLGQGWSLAGLSSITRSSSTVAQDDSFDPVDFDNNDRFSLDGQRLMVVAGQYGDAESEYRTEQESFSKIVAHGQQSGDPESFTVLTKNGLILEYGRTADSRVEVQGKTNILVWALNRVTDRHGNYLTVSYFENNATGEFHPSRIDYTGNAGLSSAPFASVVFTYEDRPDDFYGFVDGSRISTTKRLASIQSYYQSQLVRGYKLDYLPAQTARPSYLASVTESGSDGVSFQALRFEWDGSQVSNSFVVDAFNPASRFDPGTDENDFLKGDINGDGRSDLLKITPSSAQVWIASSDNRFSTTEFVPQSDTLGDAEEFRMSDFNGDGLADVVHFRGTLLKTWFSKGDGTFRIEETNLPESFGNGPNVQVGDFDGDGRSDIIRFAGDKVLIAISRGTGRYTTSEFVPWAGYDVGDASRYQATDLNGDGRTDFLHFYGNTLNTWIAKGDGTFSVSSSNSTTFVDNGNNFRIASINNDNKTDLFHFHDGDVDIWESRGDGKFTVQSYRPQGGLDFGGGRVKVADFNRDGFTDILRFYSDRIDLYVYTGQYSFKKVSVPLWSGYAVGEEESFALGDWNGDGAADLLHLLGTTTNVLLADYQIPGRITKFAPTAGLETNVQYQSIASPNSSGLYQKGSGANYPVIEYQRPLYVVASQSTSNGLGGFRTSTYNYGDAKYDLERKAFLGFSWQEIVDIDAGIRSRTDYGRHGESGARFVTHSETGLVNGPMLSVADYTTKVVPRGNRVYFVATELVASRSYELNGSLVNSSSVRSTYDDFGNVLLVSADYGDGFVSQTRNVFDNLVAPWLIGLLSRTETTYSAAGVPNEVRVASYSYHPGTKSLRQEVIEPDQPALSLVTTNTIDRFGNVIRVERGGIASAAGSLPTNFTTAVQNGRTVVFVTFDSSLLGRSAPDGDYKIVVDGTRVRAGGVAMGGNVAYSFFRYFGDGDGDRDVDASDFSRFLATYRRNSSHPSYSAAFDSDSDGDVDATDYSAFLANYRKTLQRVAATIDSASPPPSGYVSSIVVENGAAQRGMVRTIAVYFDRVVDIDSNAFRVAAADADQLSVVEMFYGADGRFLQSTRNVLGHEIRFENDPALGLLTRQTDANGLSTTFVYDGFGRLVRENYADGTKTVYGYGVTSPGQGLASATRFTIATTDGSGPVKTYYDSLFRPIRSEYTGFDGTPIYVDQEFDFLGRVSRSSDPYFAGTADAVWTTVQYDAISRPVREIAPGNRTTTVAYAGRQITTTNAVGQSRTERVNAAGQLIAVVDNLGGVLNYQYDAIGNLVRTTDVEGNVTRMEYDDRGNQTLLVDPNLGATRFTYNVFGELIEQVDAKQQSRRYAYDPLGRLVRQNELEGVSTWQYDVGPNAVGMLTRVTGPRGYQYTLAYDSLSRPKSTTLTPETGAASYTITNEYDALSRLQRLVYPSGFSVQYAYNQHSYLTQVTADGHQQPVWRADQVNARGQLVQQTLGNGAVTGYQYDSTTGYLRGIVTPGIQNLSYDYNNLGSLTRRADNLRNVSETFQYDGLERLQKADVFHAAALASTVNVAYSPGGRITFRSDVGNYNYAPSGSARPNAVQSITTAAGAVLHQYGYDANGNRVAKDGDQTVYTSYDMPVSIKSGDQRVEFSYGPGNDRIRQRTYKAGALESVKTYVGGLYEVEERGGETTQTHYISGATGTVAIYEVVNGVDRSTKYLHTDHLGSIQAISDEGGRAIETLSFDPWGQRRDAATWLPGTPADSNTSRGFTGHEQLDDVGLVHMNGRVYDPQIGRFLSADPFVQSPTNSQSYDRYAYVFNNPLSLTDPSGYWGGIGGAIKGAWDDGKEFVEDAIPDELEDLPGEAGKVVPDEIKQADPTQAIINVGVAVATGNREDIAQAVVQGVIDYAIDSVAIAAAAYTGNPAIGSFVDIVLSSAAKNATSGLFGNNDPRPNPSSPPSGPGYGAPNTPGGNPEAQSQGKNNRKYPFDDDENYGPGATDPDFIGSLLDPVNWIAGWGSGVVTKAYGLVFRGVTAEAQVAARAASIEIRAATELPIKGFRGSLGSGPTHALHRAIERGVSPQAILKTVKRPTAIIQQAGGRTMYLTDEAAVILDSQGQAVTIWGGAQHNAKTLELLRNALNGK